MHPLQLRHRHIAMLVAPHRLNILALLCFAAPATPAMLATVTSTLRLPVSYYSHHRVSRNMPVNMPHMVYLLKQHRHAPTATCQYHPSGNTSCALSYYLQEKCKYRPCGVGAILLVQILVQELVLFLHREPSFFLWSNFGQSKPDGLGYTDTVDSDVMHHQHRLSVLQWNPGPARKNPTNIIAAACGKFHAVILQEASDHVTHISDQFIAYTGNTDLAILINKDTFEPDCTMTRQMTGVFLSQIHKCRKMCSVGVHRERHTNVRMRAKKKKLRATHSNRSHRGKHVRDCIKHYDVVRVKLLIDLSLCTCFDFTLASLSTHW